MRTRHQPILFPAVISLALVLLAPLPDAAAAQPSDYQVAREHLIDDRFDQALDLFRELAQAEPTTDQADDAQYYVAYTLTHLGREQEAIEAYDQLLERWPDSLRAESARANRAELIGRQGGSSQQDSLEQILSSATWEVRRDTAVALARKGNLSAADVLDEMMRRESTGRKIELVEILGGNVSDQAARRLLVTALEPSQSTSVQLKALRQLAPVVGDREIALAIQRALADPVSTSVKIAAIEVLAPEAASSAARQALAQGLALDNSTSVQIAASQALKGHLLEQDIRAAVVQVFRGPAPTAAQLKVLDALQGNRNDSRAAEVLRAAIGSPGATSVKVRALKLAGASNQPEVLAVAQSGLEGPGATVVQLEALKVIARAPVSPDALDGIRGLFTHRGTATSVLLKAIEALEPHMASSGGAATLAKALHPELATSVQLEALDLVAQHREREELRDALASLLRGSSTATSVQLKAVDVLSDGMGEAQLRAVVAAALRAENATSVQLKAVAALEPMVSEQDVRTFLVSTLARDRSTSVVLQSMKALSEVLDEDQRVKDSFVRVMEDHRISTAARVLAAEQLLPEAKSQLRQRIADAMEDVVVRLRERKRPSGHRQRIEEALRILREIDPERAQQLAD